VPVCRGTSVALVDSSSNSAGQLGVNVWRNRISLQPRFKNSQWRWSLYLPLICQCLHCPWLLWSLLHHTINTTKATENILARLFCLLSMHSTDHLLFQCLLPVPEIEEHERKGKMDLMYDKLSEPTKRRRKCKALEWMTWCSYNRHGKNTPRNHTTGMENQERRK